MRTWFPFFAFLLSCLLSGVARADDPPATPMSPAEVEQPFNSNGAVRATRRGGKMGSAKKGGKEKPSATAIRGKCTILETPLNPISGPCVSVPLELKDAHGTSMGLSRTNAQGAFDFAVEGDGPYTIGPTSSYYILVAPADGVVHRGAYVEVKIKGKN